MRIKDFLRRTKKATAIALIFALCCGIIISFSPETKVYAASIKDLEEKIAEIEAQNKEIDKEILSIDADISDSKELQDLVYQKLVVSKDQLDYYNNLLYYKELDISEKEDEIRLLDEKISAKEEEIAQKEKDIDALDEENKKNLEKFGEIVRALYISGGVDFASVLAESSDFYDLMIRTKLLANISEQNERFMEELQQSIDELKGKIDSLEQDIQLLDADKTRSVSEKLALEEERAELLEYQQEAKELNDSYNYDYNQYSALISNFEQRQDALEGQRKANADEVAKYEEMIAEEIRKAQEGSNQSYLEGEWIWPLENRFTMITTYFGFDGWRNGNHSGIDISGGGINGTNIYAAKGGTVIKAKTTYTPGYSYGKYVVIDHGDGYSTLYGHCSEVYVTEGQKVSQGEVIAAVGSTGWSTGPHLHFEVRINGVAKNPFDYVHIP